ncbi:MAG: hypothetical protein PF443_09715, partial [Allgaiera sp.]|nr:hypothetical protein [Allgaiera sp.]
MLAPEDALPARLVGQVLASEAGDLPAQAREAAVLTVGSAKYRLFLPQSRACVRKAYKPVAMADGFCLSQARLR